MKSERNNPNNIINPVLERFKIETACLNSLESYINAANVIRNQGFNLDELISCGFCPYFPTHLYQTEPNTFSTEGINDAENIICRNLQELQKYGLYHAWVVGSAAVGLSRYGRFGVEKLRIGNQAILYQQTPINNGDIDINLLVDNDGYDSFVDRLHTIASRMRGSSELQTPENFISFYVIPFQDELNMLLETNETYALTTYTLFVHSNHFLFEDVTGNHQVLCDAALTKIRNEREAREYFFENTADRWLHGICKMLIKEGCFESIYMSSGVIPTLFSEASKNKTRRDNGYFKI